LLVSVPPVIVPPATIRRVPIDCVRVPSDSVPPLTV
jgi:hypothetical protein